MVYGLAFARAALKAGCRPTLTAKMACMQEAGTSPTPEKLPNGLGMLHERSIRKPTAPLCGF